MQATWKPHEKHGQLTKRSDLPDTVHAFPKQRKEPLTDAQHVRNAVARLIKSLALSDRIVLWRSQTSRRLQSICNVDLSETSWHDLGVHPQRNRKEAAAKGAATRKREEKS